MEFNVSVIKYNGEIVFTGKKDVPYTIEGIEHIKEIVEMNNRKLESVAAHYIVGMGKLKEIHGFKGTSEAVCGLTKMRMAGENIRIPTITGSGNQGILLSIPLYELYEKAYTPLEWFGELKRAADREKIVFFATAFDKTSVDLLEKIDVPFHKIASFEIVDIPLIKYAAGTKKPLILSTGIATLGEIGDERAVEPLIALLKDPVVGPRSSAARAQTLRSAALISVSPSAQRKMAAVLLSGQNQMCE